MQGEMLWSIRSVTPLSDALANQPGAPIRSADMRYHLTPEFLPARPIQRRTGGMHSIGLEWWFAERLDDDLAECDELTAARCGATPDPRYAPGAES